MWRCLACCGCLVPHPQSIEISYLFHPIQWSFWILLVQVKEPPHCVQNGLKWRWLPTHSIFGWPDVPQQARRERKMIKMYQMTKRFCHYHYSILFRQHLLPVPNPAGNWRAHRIDLHVDQLWVHWIRGACSNRRITVSNRFPRAAGLRAADSTSQAFREEHAGAEHDADQTCETWIDKAPAMGWRV